jgi:hypothetical protein
VIEQEPAKREKGYWQKPENYVSLLTLLAVATYTGFQIYQTYLIRDNNIVSERAFIFNEGPQVSIARYIKDNTIRAVIGVPFINGGNTATKGLTTTIHCAPSVEAPPEPWVLLYRDKVEQTPEVIGPHQTVKVYCGFTLDQLRQIRDGKLYGYLIGESVYQDRLDDRVTHRTQFSWEVTDINIEDPPPNFVAIQPNAAPNVRMNFVPRGQHNCADEECPKE